MRLFNIRYICSLRRSWSSRILMLMVVLFVIYNMNALYTKHRDLEPSRLESITRPWRFVKGNTCTKLTTNSTCSTKVFLLILVSSYVGHFDRRNFIRKTWGLESHVTPRWRTVFLLSTNDNQVEMKRLNSEGELYGDLIRSEYKESFANMSLKVAMGFEWAIKFCNFNYLLKSDDDVFVNIYGLLRYLLKYNTLNKQLYTGNPMVNSPVLRKGRYAVHYKRAVPRDDQLNKTHFAPYCSGGGFVLSRDVVRLVFDEFDFEHPLNIDDAYIGELALRRHVALLHNSKNFKMYADKCEYNADAFVQHPAKGKCLEKLYAEHIRFLTTEHTVQPHTSLVQHKIQPTKTDIDTTTSSSLHVN